MADDTIYRKAAIKAIEDLQSCYNGFSDTYDKACIIGALEEVPSAQRTGRWEYVKKRLIRGGYVDASECSVCHKRIMPHLKPNFCPNCGCAMKGEEE